ncbi:Hpt domain-containing protein [Sinimarinibacterium flocculans]|uniref:Hpt domain-containing protein n=1 Tax=Sinimarinibacterium flocculans TaxID=985250 RepID=UPI0035128335
MSTTPIDAQVLDALARETGPELFATTLELFLFELVEQHTALQALAGADDVERLRALAHTLKSSAATLGAMPLSRAAAHIEDSCRRGVPPGAEACVELAQLIERTRDALAELLCTKGAMA